MKKMFVIALFCLALSGCGGRKAEYNDGTYTGKSTVFEADESGNGAGYGEVSLEIKDGRISACTFRLYEPDGSEKDETYGQDLTKENRLKAQKAVQSAAKYAAQLVSTGSADDVDAISGATISYNEFRQAVEDALKKAEKK